MKLQQLHENEHSIMHNQLRKLVNLFKDGLASVLPQEQLTAVRVKVDVLYEDLLLATVSGFVTDVTRTVARLGNTRKTQAYMRGGYPELELILKRSKSKVDLSDLSMVGLTLRAFRPVTYTEFTDFSAEQTIVPFAGLDQLELTHAKAHDGMEWQLTGTIRIEELL